MMADRDGIVLLMLRLMYVMFISLQSMIWIILATPLLTLQSISQILYSIAIDHIQILQFDLKDKHILITGCGSGFGLELAGKLAKKGCIVYANTRTQQGADKLKLYTNHNKNIHTLVFDVTEHHKVLEAKEHITKLLQGKPLWAVINNAGITSHGLIEATSMQEFRRNMDVNLFAAVSVSKTFLPLLRQDLKNPGRIINISSMAGRLASQSMSAYNASKFALEGFSDALRREMMYFGVDVVVLEPSYFSTPMVTRYVQKEKEQHRGMNADLQKVYEKTVKAQSRVNIFLRDGLAESPSVAVDEIMRAVYARWPLLRGLVGMQALFVFPLVFSAPTGVADWILRV
jgi:NAD(P)-dependent dehydrogenase (short-subunit alcohol dehydrogenase family)